jgi:predicted nuclease of restriction endonuclease-like (RecB) superfamily
VNYNQLVLDIRKISQDLQNSAVKAINMHLSLRNWLIGYYIVEFEQNGKDRAKYGKQLLAKIAEKASIKGLSETNLKLCRQFYNVYPHLFRTLSQELSIQLPLKISQLLTDQFRLYGQVDTSIGQLPTDQFKNNDNSYLLSLIKTISFTQFAVLIQINDPVKRKFYELLILKTTPSVKELKRQIETLAYERLGLSSNYQKALAQLNNKINPGKGIDIIKSHYFFDFLNIRQPQLIEETELEHALIKNLQNFILEMGHGFCFEARQKRILIGDTYYFVDLVFYHRVLKCHVLVELKTKHAKYENIGQLKVYLEHYKRKEMLPDDNPPVGILLVTGQNKTLVEYAVAESDKELFVSQYLLELPDKKELALFIENELKELK